MQKEFYFDNIPPINQFNNMWTRRTVEEELKSCDIQSPVRELLLSYLPIKGRILEAGCGLGKWVIYLKQRGYDIIGIDNNKLAVAKLKTFDESLSVELCDVLDIHYPNNYFDACISMGVIEHFESGPTLALKEAWRVLKPNGLIFVSVPTVNYIRRFVRRFVWSLLRTGINTLRKKGIYYHFSEYRYSKSELEEFLRQSNFEIIKTVPDDFYGSKDHAVGLWMDIPFLRARDGVNFRLNSIGKLVSKCLDKASLWIACSSVFCIARSLKKQYNEVP